jgi:hypothetical protein
MVMVKIRQDDLADRLHAGGLKARLSSDRRDQVAEWVRADPDPAIDDLTAAGGKFGQQLAVGVGKWARLGANPFGKHRNHLCVESIGLGQVADRAAKSRICRGLTTASGKFAPASAAATVNLNPPVASSTIWVGSSSRE